MRMITSSASSPGGVEGREGSGTLCEVVRRTMDDAEEENVGEGRERERDGGRKSYLAPRLATRVALRHVQHSALSLRHDPSPEAFSDLRIGVYVFHRGLKNIRKHLQRCSNRSIPS